MGYMQILNHLTERTSVDFSISWVLEPMPHNTKEWPRRTYVAHMVLSLLSKWACPPPKAVCPPKLSACVHVSLSSDHCSLHYVQVLCLFSSWEIQCLVGSYLVIPGNKIICCLSFYIKNRKDKKGLVFCESLSLQVDSWICV